jgi:D-3-phosphoglycerate dehydrogenase
LHSNALILTRSSQFSLDARLPDKTERGTTSDMTRPLVVLTDASIRPEAAAHLGERCEVHVLPGAYPAEDMLIAACANADAILARLGTVTRRVIEAAPRLRVIARHGVGVDAVDLEAATVRGIVVTTTGAINAAAVAEYTFALLLALARKVVPADAGMRRGAWSRDPLVGMELDGKTLGIVGLGAIGQRVARQALGFGMRVIAHDPNVPTPPDAGIRMVSLVELLASADIVTLHTRFTPGTAKLIDAATLAAMRPNALLVNTARGELVDEAALTAALRNGGLAGAALDTFAEEPLSAESPLRAMPNVVLSPHVAGQTAEAVVKVGLAAADAILDELAGRRPAHVYNPEAYVARLKNGSFAVPILHGSD